MTTPFITYRGQIPIQTNTSDVSKNIPLTVQEMDKNLYTLAYEISLRAPIHNAIFTGTTVIPLVAIQDGTIEATDVGINIPATGRFTSLIAEDSLTLKGSTTSASQYFRITNGDTSPLTKFLVDSANGNTAISGTVDVTGATALASTLAVTGNTTMTADLAVNGGDITTSATTFNLVDTTATTVNLARAGTAITIGATTGTTTIRNATTAITGLATVGGTLGVTGATTLSSTLAVTGATTLSSTLAVTGNTTMTADLAVNGGDITTSATTFNLVDSVATTVNLARAGTAITIGATTGVTTIRNATTAITGLATVGGTLGVTGATTLSSTLAVTSNTTVGGTLGVTGASTLTGNTSIGGALFVTGLTTMSGGTTVSGSTIAATEFFRITNGSGSPVTKFLVDSAQGDTDISGTLDVTGATAIASTLGVTGATTLSSTLGVTGNTTVGGTLGVTSNTTVGGTLGVTGATTLSSTLGVTGATTIQTLSATAGTFSSTLGVTGNTTVGGTLGVTGATTIQTLSATSGTFSSTLGVTGNTTLTTASITTLGVTSNTTVGGTLGVTGATTIQTLSATAGAFSSTLGVTGNTTVGGTLGVTGATTLSTASIAALGVTGNTTVGGTLGVTGASTLAGVTATSVSSPTYVSTISTGTAPLTVASTTRVLNLNVAAAGIADQLLNSRTINSVGFNGTANINVSNLHASNGLVSLETTGVTSAVNRLSVTNSITNVPITVSASGTDANIGITVQSKGAADVEINSGSSTSSINLKSGAGSVRFYDNDSSHYYQMVTGNRTANYNITLPAGDVILTAGTTVVTDATSQGIAGTKTFTGTLSVTGSLTTTNATVVTNLNADKVDGFDIAPVNTSGTSLVDTKYGLAIAPNTATGTVSWVAPGPNGYILESTGVGGTPRWISPSGEFQVGNAALSANISAGAAGDLLHQSAANVTAKLPIGTSGTILVQNGTGPTWSNTVQNITVSGNITHSGLTMTAGTDIDQLYSATDGALVVGTGWVDTSVNATELASGTYMVQVTSGTEIYSGVMSWYASDINTGVTDEIVLHKASSGSETSSLFLRIERTDVASPDMTLQISSSASRSSASYTYKFRRMI